MVMKRNLSSQGITFLQKSVRELIAAVANIEPKHEKETIALVNSYKKLYPRWVFELRCGFGLLTYGFGYKKALIESFASTAFAEYPVVVINGYLQSINLKQVIIALTEVWWDQLKTRQRTSLRILPKV
ncbi:origin of replication complex subunit 2-like isoform X2 [Hevea brasiliensis]|uniref:origin of replication complex subunit 2-like isoform X2 n=1 Tax=Hevea brasiliensis TaxID=3981 RepID=UPI0025E22897|nr:origin of replication complex subunit 2-like isoform X2 [Hevea brasiliensis]